MKMNSYVNIETVAKVVIQKRLIFYRHFCIPVPASDENLRIPLAYQAIKTAVVFSQIKTRKQKR
jgi:hypothetical protein